MAVNKVIFGNSILIDLTDDTVTEDALIEGYTAHGADGELITGKAIAAEKEPSTYSPATLILTYYSQSYAQEISFSFKYIDDNVDDNDVRTLANTILDNKDIFKKIPTTLVNIKLVLNDGTERNININS